MDLPEVLRAYVEMGVVRETEVGMRLRLLWDRRPIEARRQLGEAHQLLREVRFGLGPGERLARQVVVELGRAARVGPAPARALDGREAQEGQEVVRGVGADLPVVEHVEGRRAELLGGVVEAERQL